MQFSFSTHFAAMLQNKLDVFVARFTIPLIRVLISTPLRNGSLCRGIWEMRCHHVQVSASRPSTGARV